MAENELPETIPITSFATLLGITPRRVRQQIAAGLVKAAGRGEVEFAASIRALLEDAREARETAPLAAARAQLLRARAASAEIELAKRDGLLMDVEEARALFQELAGLLVAGLSGLPVRIAGRDVAMRRKVEAICDQLRNELADRFERRLP